MHVLQLIDGLGHGGKERQFVELLKGLEERQDFSCSAVVMSRAVHYVDFEALKIRRDFIVRKIKYDPLVYTRLASVVLEVRPRIIHSWSAMCSIYAAPIAKLFGAKFVNGYVRDANKGGEGYDTWRRQGALTIPLSDVVVANSQAGLSAYRIPTKKGVCIRNGFDSKRLTRLRLAQDVREELGVTTPFVVGMVGAFDRQKDYDSFFALARSVTKTRSDVTFVAVGDGPKMSLFERKLVETPEEKIKLLGRRSDIEDIVSTFTLGVLMSRGEGISNAIMEYMALSKPVIASLDGGNSEVVEHGVTGYLVREGDIAALTKYTHELLDDSLRANMFGANGKRRIEKDFSLDRMTQEYVSLYQRLVS